MRRKILVLSAVLVVAGVGAAIAYGSKFAMIRHEELDFFDEKRDRRVDVDMYVRRDTELKANAGLSKMRVAIVNHGYTVKHKEYTFISSILAAQGYLVASVQHDLPTDAPLSLKGAPYVGRLPMYERGVDNIKFAIEKLKAREPNADYSKLTLVGHSNGGDISMFFAGQNPDMVTKIITLDNLRVPFVMNGKSKILSFRSKDWKPDPGVVPSDEMCDEAGIELVRTDAQHVEMSDRGPERVKETIKQRIARFLSDDSPPKPVSEKIARTKFSIFTP